MHKNHLLGCAVGVGAAIVLLRLTGGSLGAAGVLVAALACPLMMLVMMKMMMGTNASSSSTPAEQPEVTAAPHDTPIR